MGAEWPCEHCDQYIQAKDHDPHVCDARDVAEKLQSEAQYAAESQEERIEALEKVVAILANATLTQRATAGEDAKALILWLVREKDEDE